MKIRPNTILIRTISLFFMNLSWLFGAGHSIIGITGGSASGKTTLVRETVRLLNDSRVGLLAQDRYFAPDQQSKEYHIDHSPNYDHPTAMDLTLLRGHIQALSQGEKIKAPQYDFKTGHRMAETESFGPFQVTLLEGIHVLHDQDIRDQLSLKVFVDYPSQLRLQRRITRDMEERGYSLASIIEFYSKIVEPMHQKFIEPTRVYADEGWILSGDSKDGAARLASFVQELLK